MVSVSLMSAVSHTRVRLSKRERTVSEIRDGVRSRTLARAPDFGDATINVVAMFHADVVPKALEFLAR